jgi:alkylated DNA repair protein (DNA oxidative demethylase)
VDGQMDDLFEPPQGTLEVIGERACLLHRLARADAPAWWAAVRDIERDAPFRHMVTPGGFTMSVALTNCGDLGWTSDRRGYRYSRTDPQTGRPWPAMPALFLRLARAAAAAAGFDGFEPDACLVNRYVPGTRLSLHQDKNEVDFTQPIVSVSLGMPAVFLFGGHARTDPTQRVPLRDGDVVVWGGVDRLRYHGVLPVKELPHPLWGAQRINLTFRRAA